MKEKYDVEQKARTGNLKAKRPEKHALVGVHSGHGLLHGNGTRLGLFSSHADHSAREYSKPKAREISRPKGTSKGLHLTLH